MHKRNEYKHLAADQSKKIDDTGTSYDPLDPTRTVWPSSST